MSALTNPKHERFAQELAKGRKQIEAYTEAGYKRDDGAASRLSGNVKVQERVTEIQERAATRTEITVASVTENLTRIAQAAEELKGAPGLAVARAAWMDAAKLNGLVVEQVKAEVETRIISDQPLTPEEWAQEHAPRVMQ